MDTPPPPFMFLACCARIQGHPAHAAALAHQAAALPSWDRLPQQAELHGLAPLVAHQLAAAPFPVPPAVIQDLRGYAMHYAHQSRVQLQVLSEILACYESVGIPALVLKGAALSTTLYPRPALRPMRDLDLLVPAELALQAQTLLADLDFTLPPSPTHGLWEGHHHLASPKRTHHGVLISVEVHHMLDLAEAGRPPRRYADFAGRTQMGALHGVPLRVMSKEDQLWHSYRHTFAMPVGYEALRLIWVADLVSMVEAWVEDLDWDYVRRVYPAVYATLPLLHHLTPWSPTVIEHLRLPITRPPRGVGAGFDGWPRRTFAQQRPKGLWQSVQDSIFPSPWWLGLHYGMGGSRRAAWRAWWAHQRWLWPLVLVNIWGHLQHHSYHRRLVLRQRGRAALQRLRVRRTR